MNYNISIELIIITICSPSVPPMVYIEFCLGFHVIYIIYIISIANISNSQCIPCKFIPIANQICLRKINLITYIFSCGLISILKENRIFMINFAEDI